MTVAPVFEMNIDRSLPTSVEAERSILGGIMLDNRTWSQAAQSLIPEDFSLDSHRRIYRHMVEMAASNTPIDLVTMVEELRRRRELEAVGDAGYIASLVDGVPDRPSIDYYVRIVKEKAQLRGLIFAANAAIARAMDGEKRTDIAGGLLETVLDVEAQAQKSYAIAPQDVMPEVLRELEMQAQAGALVGLPTDWTH